MGDMEGFFGNGMKQFLALLLFYYNSGVLRPIELKILI
jgi:hypothetical protein